MICALALAAMLVVAGPSASPERFTTLLVSSPSIDGAAFDQALALRLPDVDVRRRWNLTETPIPRRYAFVHVTKVDEVITVEVITARGEAYVRQIAKSEASERVVATFVVSLIASIESQTVEAVRDDVEAPQTESAPAIERAVGRMRSREPVAATPEGPAPILAVKPQPRTIVRVEEVPTIQPWSVGVGVQLGLLLGIPPPSFGSVLAAGGGALELRGRSPTGFVVGAQIRALGRETRQAGLLRVRTGAFVGYAHRWRKAELEGAVLVGFEPWAIRRDGVAVPAGELGAQSVATSIAAWLAGGVRLQPGPVGVRLGGRFELGGGFVFDGGARVAGIRDVDGEPLFRVGGLEASLLADVVVDIPRLPFRRAQGL